MKIRIKDKIRKFIKSELKYYIIIVVMLLGYLITRSLKTCIAILIIGAMILAVKDIADMFRSKK